MLETYFNALREILREVNVVSGGTDPAAAEIAYCGLLSLRSVRLIVMISYMNARKKMRLRGFVVALPRTSLTPPPVLNGVLHRPPCSGSGISLPGTGRIP
jgi:hypothetical protein